MENDVVTSPSACQKTQNSVVRASAQSFSPLTTRNSADLTRLLSEKTVNCSDKENLNMNIPQTTPPPATTTNTAIDEAKAMERASRNRLQTARLIIDSHLYQDLLNRYGIAVTRLHELSNESTSLMQQNELLRSENEDLTRRFTSVLQFSQSLLLQNSWSPYASTSASVLSVLEEDLRRNNIDRENARNNAMVSNNSLTSVIDQSDEIRSSECGQRFCLPKSISVRSNGYLKMIDQVNAAAGYIDPGPSRAPRVSNSLVDAMKVYVKSREDEEEEKATVEMSVYEQGMYKTELCNKWQETGSCPLMNSCQFAHGLSELRPVLRHPRYKTQLCRMLLAGGTCPYGHRCHFRHSLSESEKPMSAR